MHATERGTTSVLKDDVLETMIGHSGAFKGRSEICHGPWEQRGIVILSSRHHEKTRRTTAIQRETLDSIAAAQWGSPTIGRVVLGGGKKYIIPLVWLRRIGWGETVTVGVLSKKKQGCTLHRGSLDVILSNDIQSVERV